MKIKTKNLIQLISQGMALLLLIFPGFYVYEQWAADKSLFGVYEAKHTDNISFFAKMASTEIGLLFAILFIVIAIIALVVFILQCYKSVHIGYAWTLPVVQFVCLLIYTAGFQRDDASLTQWIDPTSHFSKYPAGVLFYLFSAIIISLSVYSYLSERKISMYGIIKEQTIQHKSNLADAPSELLKYKDLLDKGVITQEEFEAKKKQVLGL